MPKKQFKWQKVFLQSISRSYISDKDLFVLIHSLYSEFDRFMPRDYWKEEQAVSELKKRMGW